jgi:hypothetical protein
MKPVKNFRKRLNDIEIWHNGIMFRLKLPMMGAEDLLWIIPENVEHNWKPYIKFKWHKDEYWISRSPISGSWTEYIGHGKIEPDKFQTHTEFMNSFLTPVIEDLSLKESFW